MQKPSKAFVIFALMPFTYYLLDYVTSVYTALLYSGKQIVSEFLGFVLCIAYLLFLLVYFKQYEGKREAEQRYNLMEMQSAQSQREIEAIKRSEYSVSLFRHDMRHFLVNIAGFINNRENKKATEYIKKLFLTPTKRPCANTVETRLSI